MQNWQNNFAKRLNAIRDASSHEFTDHVRDEILPAFHDLAAFVETGGLTACESRPSPQVQSVRFSMAADLCVEIIFTLAGPCQVEAAYRIHAGQHAATDAMPLAAVSLASASEGWARKQMQDALDQFMTVVERILGAKTTVESA